jgi:two-component system chemotaxis family response regulator WspR
MHDVPSSPLLPTEPAQDYTAMVMLVDDQAIVGEAVRRMLAGHADIDFHYCGDAQRARQTAEEIKPTVILQDLVLPGIDGLSLVSDYRAQPATRQVPIIVLSIREDPLVKRDAFKAGANDYLVKLPDPIELVARIRHHSRAYLNQLQRDEAYRALRESQQKLLEANLELQRLSVLDGLTGLSNRRNLNVCLEAEWLRAKRDGTIVSLLMIDVDDFKAYNDSYGHLAGDEVLKRLAELMQAHTRRSTDLAARYGGEEFAMLLPHTPADGALQRAQSLCQSMAALRLPHRASAVADHVTLSIGVASRIPQREEAPVVLIGGADSALYKAKHGGKNRVVAPAPSSA